MTRSSGRTTRLSKRRSETERRESGIGPDRIPSCPTPLQARQDHTVTAMVCRLDLTMTMLQWTTARKPGVCMVASQSSSGKGPMPGRARAQAVGLILHLTTSTGLRNHLHTTLDPRTWAGIEVANGVRAETAVEGEGEAVKAVKADPHNPIEAGGVGASPGPTECLTNNPTRDLRQHPPDINLIFHRTLRLTTCTTPRSRRSLFHRLSHFTHPPHLPIAHNPCPHFPLLQPCRLLNTLDRAWHQRSIPGSPRSIR